MPKINNDLLFKISAMFIQNIMRTYDLQEPHEEAKLSYLNKLSRYCEHCYDQRYEPKQGNGDGWLLLKDSKGESHDVAYRGVWTIDKLKDLLSNQFIEARRLASSSAAR